MTRPRELITGDVYLNRILNFKSLLEINRVSVMLFCQKHSLPYNNLLSMVSKLQGKMSDAMAHKIENAFNEENGSLDNYPDKLNLRVKQFRLDFQDKINAWLGGNEYSNRYWNVRRYLGSGRITLAELSRKTGVHSVYCTQVLSERPVKRIGFNTARKFEQAFSLPDLFFEIQAVESPAIEPLLTVSEKTIDFLGTGAFLNRFVYINDFIIKYRLNKLELHKVLGFDYQSDDDYLRGIPIKLISYESARDFERKFDLESGILDIAIDGYDFSYSSSLFTVSLAAFDVIGVGDGLFRYVNLRRLMIDRGLNLLDLAKLIGKTRALTHQLLSDKPVRYISGKSARYLENELGLEPMSLDQSVTFALESLERPVKNRLRGSPTPARVWRYKNEKKAR